MKMTKTIVLTLPVALLLSGCQMLPSKKASEDLVVTAPEVTELAEQPIQSTFLEGDTLWDFAERTTGSGFNWEKIKELNGITDEKNIDAGIVLLVPPELAVDSLKTQ